VLARPASTRPLWATLSGHYFTLVPSVRAELSVEAHRLRGAWRRVLLGEALPAPSFRTPVMDPQLGAIELSGELHAPPAAHRLLLCVHGLGGSSHSGYLRGAASRAAALGWASLRLNLRGADGNGEDFYHAALTADLHAALASPALARFTDVYVLGFSLGGHLALRLASEPHDTRLRAVAAVCAPIDLARSVAAIDRPALWLYRTYVLRRLKQSYVAVARRRTLAAPLERVLAAQTLREWDACTVVPRHGFGSTDDYYARASVAPRLGELRVPSLLLETEDDPMVPAASVRPALPSRAPQLDVRWLQSGGHVGLPARVDLGEAAPPALGAQVLAWLERAGAASSGGAGGSVGAAG